MNEQTIEKLLQKAPPVRPPVGLLEELQSSIELPRTINRNPESRVTRKSPFRRWLPALGFALWFLGCIVVFGIQASHIAELKRANEIMRTSAVSAGNREAEQTRVGLLAAELEQLRKDAADVQRLRAEVEQLRTQAAQLDTLRAQNQQLREELKAQNASVVSPKPEEDFFAVAKERSDRIKCVANLKQVCLAALIWSTEHNDVLPRDFEPMKKDLATEKLTFCPREQSNRYEIISPGVSRTRPEVAFVRCAFHNNVGLCDGSVHQLSAGLPLVQTNGEWVIGRAGQ